MGQTAGFPRASDSALLASSPMIGHAIQTSGTAMGAAAGNTAFFLSLAVQNQGQVVAGPGQWSVLNAPASNTQATATKAAGGASVRHIAQALTATLSNQAATAAAVGVVVRDGASGAGTIIFDATLTVPATTDSCIVLALSGLNLIGSPNTAMTIEFFAAGGASVFETVFLAGYDTI